MKDTSTAYMEPEVYYVLTDMKQTHNLYSEKKEVAKELHSKMIFSVAGVERISKLKDRTFENHVT